MKPKTFMIIAGEASGDLLAAELVQALRAEFEEAPPVVTADYQPLETSFEPRFFGAGGKRMAEAGVELAFDLTAHSVIGISDVVRNIAKFRRLFRQLYRLALDRAPDVIICVDFGGFNRRFAHAIKKHVRARRGWFHDWDPKIVQYVSPQVWASRETRAFQIAADYDVVLSIFPFETEWYARRVPNLRVEFIGHPLLDRYKAGVRQREGMVELASPSVLLLPGSRPSELKRHLPVMLAALEKVKTAFSGLNARMVLPDIQLEAQAKRFTLPPYLKVQTGGLPEALAVADVAIASTGTVTMECAYFGVPTVAIYKTSWSTYQIGKRIVTVDHLAMPNLMAREEIFPEFIQERATPRNIAEATIKLLRDETKRRSIKNKMAEIIEELGAPGASERAARIIAQLSA